MLSARCGHRRGRVLGAFTSRTHRTPRGGPRPKLADVSPLDRDGVPEEMRKYASELAAEAAETGAPIFEDTDDMAKGKLAAVTREVHAHKMASAGATSQEGPYSDPC